MIEDRDGATARLREQPDDALLDILAAHDTSEWEPEVFDITRGLLAERGVDVAARLAARVPPPPEVDHTEDPLEVVATFGVVPDAEPCRAGLVSAGFDVFLLDENLLNVDPALWPMLKGVKMAVPHSQAEEAREFLAAVERGELSQSPEVAIRCGACGSGNVRFVSHGAHRLAAAVIPLLGAGPASSYECADCGAQA